MIEPQETLWTPEFLGTFPTGPHCCIPEVSCPGLCWEMTHQSEASCLGSTL